MKTTKESFESTSTRHSLPLQNDMSRIKHELQLSSNLSKSKIIPVSKLTHLSNINNLSHWIKKFGSKADKLLKENSQTFTDQNGIKRYLNNWMIVDESANDYLTYKGIQIFYSQTGCIHKRVCCQHLEEKNDEEVEEGPMINEEDSKTQNPLNTSINHTTSLPYDNTNQDIINTSFLNDWHKLWTYFENDKEDEIAIQAPLFRLFVEYFFHRRTAQFMIFLFVYNYIVYTILFIMFPSAFSPFLYVYHYLDTFVQLLTYFIAAILFKGSLVELFWDPIEIEKANKRKSALNDTKPWTYHYSVHWCSSFYQIYAKGMKELKTLTKELQIREKKLNSSQKRNPSYYELLNISLKFLNRHNGIDPKEINFDRPTYRMMLLFVLFVFPIYLFLSLYFSSYYLWVIPKCESDFSSSFCQYYVYFAILSIGSLSAYIMQLIFGSCVLVSLVGLAYGGEIVFRLTDSWRKKFSGLRRVKKDKLCYCIGLTNLELSQFQTIPTNSTSHHDGQNLSLNSQPYSSNSTTQISTIQSESDKLIWEEYDSTLLNNDISDLIKRDAIEHYLFIKNVMKSADHIWSPILSGCFLLSLYIILTYFSYLMIYNGAVTKFSLFRIVFMICVRALFLIVYPIVSISHANSYIYEIKTTFVNSSESDFVILGGRSKWIPFIESCSIAWTYYGIWITWDRLFGLLSTAAAGIIAFIFTIFTQEF